VLNGVKPNDRKCFVGFRSSTTTYNFRDVVPLRGFSINICPKSVLTYLRIAIGVNDELGRSPVVNCSLATDLSH